MRCPVNAYEKRIVPMPMSNAFEARLYPRLEEIAAHFGTPLSYL